MFPRKTKLIVLNPKLQPNLRYLELKVKPEKAKSFLIEAVFTCLKPHQTIEEVRASAES